MEIISFLILLIQKDSGFITDYNLFVTINIGLLAVITIIFGLATLRKQLDDDFDNAINKKLEIKNRQRTDVLVTKIREKLTDLKKIINDVSKWFRKCIYCNLVVLILIIFNLFFNLLLIDILIVFIIVFSIITIGVSIHRLKKIIDLDIEGFLDSLIENLKIAKEIKETEDLKSIFELVLKQSKV